MNVELYTLDVNFDNVDNLNSSVETTRNFLDILKENNKIKGYYVMRYANEEDTFLGIKILFDNSQDKDPILKEFKENLKGINGYGGIRQKKAEGAIKDNLPLICSISMEFRNKIWDLLKRKPTDEEYQYVSHYLANPLLLNYEEESRNKLNKG
mgnify:CR=1 FL=1